MVFFNCIAITFLSLCCVVSYFPTPALNDPTVILTLVPKNLACRLDTSDS